MWLTFICWCIKIMPFSEITLLILNKSKKKFINTKGEIVKVNWISNTVVTMIQKWRTPAINSMPILCIYSVQCTSNRKVIHFYFIIQMVWPRLTSEFWVAVLFEKKLLCVGICLFCIQFIIQATKILIN